MSIGTTNASAPSAVISAAVSFSLSTLRAATTTFAPASASAIAQALPIPCDAPVTNATRSFQLIRPHKHSIIISQDFIYSDRAKISENSLRESPGDFTFHFLLRPIGVLRSNLAKQAVPCRPPEV